MTATLSSHILDTHLGKPASGIRITLHRVIKESEHETGSDNKQLAKKFIGEAITNIDGRVTQKDWKAQGISTDADGIELDTGRYTLTFATQSYFDAQNTTAFYPQVVIDFVITDTSHYHIPLLLSAHGYSTYRGS